MPDPITEATLDVRDRRVYFRFPQNRVMNAWVKTCPGRSFNWDTWDWEAPLTRDVTQWILDNAHRIAEYKFTVTPRAFMRIRDMHRGRKLRPRHHSAGDRRRGTIPGTSSRRACA